MSKSQEAVLPVNPEADVTNNSSNVYVTRGVPHLNVEVIAPNQIVINEAHAVSPAGVYNGGDIFTIEGPSAHMLEARGIVKIIDVAQEAKN